MRCRRICGLILTAGMLAEGATAFGQGSPPPGYTLTKVSGGLTTEQSENITQMTFKPGDPTHLYAARFGYGSPSPVGGGVVTRYDFDPVSGQLSNPINVATGLTGALGLAFHGNDLYVSTNLNPSLPTSLGGIIRLQDVSPGQNGTQFGNAVTFINNIPVGEHLVDQLQVRGDSLYVGIGTQTNNGDPTQESVYNGTISVIKDLTKVNYSGDGADNLALANVATDTDPGKLHVFASGFRNPYGLRVDAAGNVSATDNGADFQYLSYDLFYKNIPAGARGVFAPGVPAGQPNYVTPGATVTPTALLGLDTSADGFTPLPSGPLQNNVLVALFNGTSSGTNPPGNELVTVNPNTGVVSNFVTGLGNPLDVIPDPYGGVLVNDYGPSGYNAFDPSSGGVYRISASSVPELSTNVMVTVMVLGGVGIRWLRRRREGAA